ncbi:MAG: hypothetical protein J6P12_05715 [Methanobrevibacter sp.]|nr:hypothetical protein [Methanobrevibacter sp.]
MTILYNVGDEIIGDKIVCEARRIGDTNVINKSGRHKAQKIQLKDNARCRILKQARFLSDKK